jgi:hypothetical protein
VNSVAAKPTAQPLYAEFLARAIKIETVQCYREAVTDDHTAQFFAEGRRPGLWDDFEWSLDAPKAFSWGPLAPAPSEEPAPVSLPMQHAWDAAVAAFADFIAAFINGELAATGVHLPTGARSKIERTECPPLIASLPFAGVRHHQQIRQYFQPVSPHSFRCRSLVFRHVQA